MVFNINRLFSNLPNKNIVEKRVRRSDPKGRFATPFTSSTVSITLVKDDEGNEILFVRKEK